MTVAVYDDDDDDGEIVLLVQKRNDPPDKCVKHVPLVLNESDCRMMRIICTNE